MSVQYICISSVVVSLLYIYSMDFDEHKVNYFSIKECPCYYIWVYVVTVACLSFHICGDPLNYSLLCIISM